MQVELERYPIVSHWCGKWSFLDMWEKFYELWVFYMNNIGILKTNKLPFMIKGDKDATCLSGK